MAMMPHLQQYLNFLCQVKNTFRNNDIFTNFCEIYFHCEKFQINFSLLEKGTSFVNKASNVLYINILHKHKQISSI